MCCPSVVLSLCFWHLNQESCLEQRDSGFRNRAIKQSLKMRQLILGYKGLKKMHNMIGTPPCTLRQPWVSVCHMSIYFLSPKKKLWIKNKNTKWLSWLVEGLSSTRLPRLILRDPLFVKFIPLQKKPLLGNFSTLLYLPIMY